MIDPRVQLLRINVAIAKNDNIRLAREMEVMADIAETFQKARPVKVEPRVRQLKPIRRYALVQRLTLARA